jgi:hypothetical protein
MIGTKMDTKQRVRFACIDSIDYQNDIEAVWKLMFDSGLSVTSE